MPGLTVTSVLPPADREFIEARRRALKRFINLVARHPPFSEDTILKLFLSFSGPVSTPGDLGGTWSALALVVMWFHFVLSAYSPGLAPMRSVSTGQPRAGLSPRVAWEVSGRACGRAGVELWLLGRPGRFEAAPREGAPRLGVGRRASGLQCGCVRT